MGCHPTSVRMECEPILPLQATAFTHLSIAILSEA
jgi:hypothetical protein